MPLRNESEKLGQRNLIGAAEPPSFRKTAIILFVLFVGGFGSLLEFLVSLIE